MRELSVTFQTTQILDIIREARRMAMEEGQKGLEIEYKADGKGPVTNVDHLIHDFLMERLGQLTPGIPVISEEGDLSPEYIAQAMAADLRWVTDPIDGTSTMIEYFKGDKTQTGFGIHLGLVNKSGVPVAGYVAFPSKENEGGSQGRTFYTMMGKSSVKDGDKKARPIFAKGAISGALPLACVSNKGYKTPESLNGREFKSIPGTGGERLCIVARGDADVAWMADAQGTGSILSHWDVAASMAILRGAGGRFVDMSEGQDLILSNQDLSVPPAIGGHPDVLSELGYTDDQPKPVRELPILVTS